MTLSVPHKQTILNDFTINFNYFHNNNQLVFSLGNLTYIEAPCLISTMKKQFFQNTIIWQI